MKRFCWREIISRITAAERCPRQTYNLDIDSFVRLTQSRQRFQKVILRGPRVIPVRDEQLDRHLVVNRGGSKSCVDVRPVSAVETLIIHAIGFD